MDLTHLFIKLLSSVDHVNRDLFYTFKSTVICLLSVDIRGDTLP